MADGLRLNPALPQALARLDMRVHYRGHSIDLRLTCDALSVRGLDEKPSPFVLMVGDERCNFMGRATRVFRLDTALRAAPRQS